MDADYFKKLQAVPPFAAAATALQTGDLFSDLTGAVTAPVLYSYVWWVLAAGNPRPSGHAVFSGTRWTHSL